MLVCPRDALRVVRVRERRDHRGLRRCGRGLTPNGARARLRDTRGSWGPASACSVASRLRQQVLRSGDIGRRGVLRDGERDDRDAEAGAWPAGERPRWRRRRPSPSAPLPSAPTVPADCAPSTATASVVPLPRRRRSAPALPDAEAALVVGLASGCTSASSPVMRSRRSPKIAFALAR
jgi:hypothetical protein